MMTLGRCIWGISVLALAFPWLPGPAWGQIYKASFRQINGDEQDDAPPLPPAYGAADAAGEPYYQPQGAPEYESTPAPHGGPHSYGTPLPAEPCLQCRPAWQSYAAFCGEAPPPLIPSHWARLEYLHWWRRGQDLPPLVTLGGDGTLDDPDTRVVFGGEQVESSSRPGGRVDAGVWLDNCHRYGVGVRYFGLGDAPIEFQIASEGMPGDPLIARPIIDAQTGEEVASVVAGPDADNVFAAGSVSITGDSTVQGGDLYLRWMALGGDCGSRVDLLFGWQMSRIDESLVIATSREIEPDPFQVRDAFSARNEYHGATLGAVWHERRGSLVFHALAKIGLGSMEQDVAIAGASTGGQPGAGLLAQPTNIGVFSQSEFALSTEANVTLGWLLTDSLSATFGYSFLFWSETAQPGNQIDRVVDLSQDADSTRPQFSFRTEQYWVQGFNLGFLWTY